jgi:HEPN domain
LIAEARQVAKASGFDGRELHRWPPLHEYLKVRTRALNLVRRACGEHSDHCAALLSIAETDGREAQPQRILECLGILEAAEADFDRGLLLDLKALIHAEALGDFMEQAESLLSSGYYVPAASLAGAVLEDGLRKLCDARTVSYPPKTKIDALNSSLAKARVYDKLVQKRITGLADIRNNADHGHADKFKPDDVDDMVKWTRRFLADHLR